METMDIPTTLEDCFEYFDKKLDEKRKKEIKLNGNKDEHWGLALWIRNNWLYPKNKRRDKLLENLDCEYFLEPDCLSNEIVEKYSKYLLDMEEKGHGI